MPVSVETWVPDHIEVQEDRVIFFGTVGTGQAEFEFALKPLTKGRYSVPPIIAEGMYDSDVRFVGKPDVIEVVE